MTAPNNVPEAAKIQANKLAAAAWYGKMCVFVPLASSHLFPPLRAYASASPDSGSPAMAPAMAPRGIHSFAAPSSRHSVRENER